MIQEGKDSKGIDPHRPTEFLNSKRCRDLAKHFPVEVQVMTPYMKVFHSFNLLSLFPEVILDTSWLACADASGINDRVRLGESPQKIIRDLMLLKKRIEAFGSRLVGVFDEIKQQIKMLKRSVVEGSVVASIPLEVGEVVEEQVLFDLDRVSKSGFLGKPRVALLKVSSRRLMP